MFKEIKKQITLFNVLILIAFLLIFILLLVFMLRWNITNNSERYLREVANNIRSGEVYPNDSKTQDFHNQIGYEYIVWDNHDSIDRMKIMNSSLIMQGYSYVKNTKFNDAFKTFYTDDVSYRVYSIRFKERGKVKTLQVYQQITSELSATRTILILLLFIGCGGILVLIPISYFLAGKSLQPVKESFENQKKFIADASHELRTPLTVIQTNVEVLRLKEDEVLAENLHWLDNIASESETMSKLVSSLLTIAQADNKRIVMEKKPFDLSALCAEVVDLMYDFAAENQIDLQGDIQQNVEFKGDEEQLKRAIRILVDNAIKYTPGKGKVTIKLREGVRNVVIAISDTGVGLSEENKKKIFSRFFRVDDARNRESGGFGLGLNIADMVVNQHGGHIKIDSKLNEGSTFSIVLPRLTL